MRFQRMLAIAVFVAMASGAGPSDADRAIVSKIKLGMTEDEVSQLQDDGSTDLIGANTKLSGDQKIVTWTRINAPKPLCVIVFVAGRVFSVEVAGVVRQRQVTINQADLDDLHLEIIRLKMEIENLKLEAAHPPATRSTTQPVIVSSPTELLIGDKRSKVIAWVIAHKEWKIQEDSVIPLYGADGIEGFSEEIVIFDTTRRKIFMDVSLKNGIVEKWSRSRNR